MDLLSNVGRLIVTTVFGLYLLCVLLRFLFQLFRADFRNPISQFLVTVTNPPLKLLRRIVPGFGGVDIASLILAFLVAFAQNYLVVMLDGRLGNIVTLLISAVLSVATTLVWILIVAMLIRIVLSWVQPQGSNNPIMGVLYSLTEPIMAPARRLIKPIGGLDLSPILIFLGLQIVLMVLTWLKIQTGVAALHL